MVRVGRLDWHVQSLGDPEAPVALLVHGAGAATHSFRGLIPLLSGHYRVIAIDLPGHGFTRGARAEDLTLPGMARALAGLLAKLQVEPVLAIGHSAGVAVLSKWRSMSQSSAGPHCRPQRRARADPRQCAALASGQAAVRQSADLASGVVPGADGDMAGHLLRATGSRIDNQGRDCYAMLLRQPAHVSGALGMMANWNLEPLIARLD
jgi:magnesium chelatase accessory protein